MADGFTRLAQAITGLSTCLCNELEAAHLANPLAIARPCFCGVIVGATAVNDSFADCDTADGYAWVRLGPTYPSVSPGVPSNEKHNYKPLALGADIEVGVQRTVLMEDAQFITADEHANMVAQELSDMRSIYRAVACCTQLEDMGVILGQWTPNGPQGLTYGGALNLFVQV